MDIIKTLAAELHLGEGQVERTVALIDEGNTIPFIARYRKEVTGALDDTVLRTLDDRLRYLRQLDERREEVRAAIEAAGKLTPELADKLENAATLHEIEDIYLPFRPKRKTRASEARAKGLEPLAAILLAQQKGIDPKEEAEKFVCPDAEKPVPDAVAALQGAMDILAEDFAENAEYRGMIRKATAAEGVLCCKPGKAAEEGQPNVYETYFAFEGPVRNLPGHRVLAINRGEKEEQLKVSLRAPEEAIRGYLCSKILLRPSRCEDYLRAAIDDSYDRLIAPSVEREIRADLFDQASEGAIKVFSENLRHLLMGAPLKGKTVVGFDPGYRTGCKLAVVDPTGKVLDTAVIYPTKPREDTEGSAKILRKLIERYGAEVVSIGNGTASAESEQFVAGVLQEYGGRVKYAVVSEAGASVYSASELGAKEFPDFDVTERSAVSIARRLQDPLSELVKIDPQAIGVGQYQHDMKKARLDEALSGVVEDCVNKVGVDLNTASHTILSHIAGINAAIAKNIVAYREKNGAFRNRAQLLKVPKLGEKAFTQAAGFLRVSGGDEPFDETGVHPESYAAAKTLLLMMGHTEEELRAHNLQELGSEIAPHTKELCERLGIGEPTLRDIAKELEKPGRDVREELPPPELRSEILTMEMLKPGMKLDGVVRNVTDFGAFVDIGVHQDGLVHLSKICSRFIKHPSEVLAVGDRVKVTVLSVDLQKKRISLSMKD